MSDIDVSPTELKFRFALGRQLLSTISISNKGEGKAAFKVKTTAPKKYVVRPSSGVVPPGQSVAVQVIMQAQKEVPADIADCKDKFMVQVTSLEGDEQVDKDTFSKDVRDDLKEFRLRVLMEGPAAPPSPVAEEQLDPTSSASNHATNLPAAAGGAVVGGARGTTADSGYASSDNTSLKARLDAVTKDRDELRRRLDVIELQGGGGAAGQRGKGKAAVGGVRLSMLHLLLAALLAFVVGFYVNGRVA